MKKIESAKVREKFLDFFEKRGHKIMPSSSLLPSDSTVLFTTAGMQQFSLYLAGEKNPIEDFKNSHLASCQKCFRSDDIEEVGDDTHHTFFEMLGNWSIGQDKEGNYFKEGAIKLALEFLTGELGLDKDKLFVTVFQGDKNIPEDKESIKIWQDFGIPKEKIKKCGKDNFWGPVGDGGPCGPCSEIFYDRGEEFGCGEADCAPNCERCLRFVEIWNLVFMEYRKKLKVKSEKLKITNQNKKTEETQKLEYEYVLLPQKNVDTGIGFERLVAVLQEKPSAYETDLFLPIYKSILVSDNENEKKLPEKFLRILSDHIRGACFLISEGILPSNLGKGYVLRRVLRRSIRYAKLLKLKENWYIEPIKNVVKIYGDIYPEIKKNEEKIITVVQKEEEKFGKALERGIQELHGIFEWWQGLQRIEPANFLENAKKLGGKFFFIYQTYGFPVELSLEEFEVYFIDPVILKEEVIKFFNELMKKHQEISRAGAEKKFKGGLADESEETKKLHAAAHLLLESLRRILGEHIFQKGSNINSERLRFDFSHPEKLTDEEKQKVEDLANEQIQKNLPVSFEEIKLEDAKKIGAMGVFEEKYGDKVKVYTIGEKDNIFSREICGGPHIKNTSELGKFKIIKEQSSSAGVRRIKAVLI